MKQKGGVTALEQDDFILVQKALQGDDDAFSLLFQRYHSFLYKSGEQFIGGTAR